MFGYIYLLHCVTSGRGYIGMRRSMSICDGYFGSGTILRRAVKKWGRKSFQKMILDVANSKDELATLEQHYIKQFDAVKSKNFYNVSAGGFGGDCWTGLSEERKAFHRQQSRMRFLGRPLGPETRKLISLAKKGKPRIWVRVSREEYAVRRKDEVRRGVHAPPPGNRGNRAFRHEPDTKELLSRFARERHRHYVAVRGSYMTQEGKRQRKFKLQTIYWTMERRAQRAEAMRTRRLAEGKQDRKWDNLEEMLKTMTQSEIAAVVGVDQSAVAQRIREHQVVVQKSAVYFDHVQTKREAAAALAHQARRAQSDAFWEQFDLEKMAKTMTQAQIAAVVGKSQPAVGRRLRMMGLVKSRSG
jgi:predicted XRE-type DNA-binding protein